MKKKILFICVLGLIIALISVGGHFLYRNIMKQSQSAVSIMIASDIHYLASEYLGDYFKEPAAIFDGKATHYSNEYFDAFLKEVMEKQPAAVILSGDLTLNGSKKSHEEIIEKLTTIQEAGIEVLVIPGNHDVDSGAGDYSGEEPVYVENYTSDDFMTAYKDFGPAKAISQDETTFSYMYQVTPYLRLLMLDTNCYGKCYVHDETLVWIEEELKKAQSQGCDVIAVSHQNLHIHNEMLYFTYQLYNADKLFALYEKYNVKLNMSGHIHVQSIVTDSTIPEITIGSLAVPNTNYGELTYDGKCISYETKQTDVESYAASIGSDNDDLLNYAEYSRSYFEEVARLQTYAQLSESGLPQEDMDLLADTFGKINSAYFAGETINQSDYAEGIELWRTSQKGNFIQKYIETMLKGTKTDNRSLIIELN